MITSKERKRITDLYRASKLTRQDEVPGFALASAGANKFSSPDPSLYKNQAELYRRVPGVSTAVDMISRGAADSRLQVFRLEGEDKFAIPNHPLETLMKKPNPLDSSYEFRTATTNFRQLAGNCYWWLNKANENAEPTEIWVIPPHKIRPVPDEKLYLAGYIYDPGDGNEIPLDIWEIVHFKRFNPFDEFVGLSAIEALAVTALGDIEARKWNTRFFGENNGRLEGMITFADNIINKDWEQLKRDFKDASKKREQMMLRGVGKGGVDWHQSKATPREMEFLEGLEMNQETIWSVLAPGLASMLAVNSNEANARVGEAIFTNKTVWPWLEEAASKINHSILPFFGDNLIAEYEDIRIADRALELQEMAQYEKSHTVDETREKWYMSEPIGDERGRLLVAEVGRSGGDQVSESVTATPQNASIEESKPEDTADEPVKSELEIDLDKWRRKASKRIGESVPFESKHVPHAIKRKVLDGLEACKDKADVSAVFGAVLDVPVEKTEDMTPLLMLLDDAIKAVADEKPQPQQPQIINLTIPAKADMTTEELAAAFTSAISGIPAPNVTVTNEVHPSEAVVKAGDVVVNVPPQEKPEVNVEVNLKQVDNMKTEVRRNKKGDVTSLNTEVNNG